MSRAIILALALCLSAITATGVPAAEPFYIGLLEAGSRDYLRGDYPAAANKLRIACFGLLDDPPLLTRGLVRLALSQAGADDDDGFDETFERLLEVERAFGSYSALPADTPFKVELERLLPRRFSPEDLETVPAFAHVAAAMREARLTALPPKRLRRELERRLATDPGDSEALVLMTRLDIAQNREDRAEQRLTGLLTLNPENRMARCLHGQIRLRRDDCAGAMEDLPICSRPPTDDVLGPRYLRCLVQAADWQAAGGYLASLPLDLRRREEVANLILAIPPETLDDLARADVDPPLAAGGATAPAAETAAEPSVAEEDPIDELRRLARRASNREELEQVFLRVAEQANGRPDSPELQYLAGEIAYRRADHPAAVLFFRRGGVPSVDRPLLGFYFAVSLYEIGEVGEAATMLEAVSSRLESTPFVERYRNAILDSADNP